MKDIYYRLIILLKVKIEFYNNINNLEQISCFSNEGNKWRDSKIFFENENILNVKITEKFIGERGRVNCSLKEKDGFWRWLGIQFVISDKYYDFISMTF